MNNAFLITLLNMSLTASYTVVAVLIARLLLRKAPKWISCALWGVVAFRLICPFSFESIFSFVPAAAPIPTNIDREAVPAIESGIEAVDRVVNPFLYENFTPSLGESVNTLQMILFLGFILWLMGMAVVLFYTAVSYLLLSRRLLERVKLKENIYLCDAINTPFIMGIFRPKIFLPSSLEESVAQSVIAHEQAHIKRRDHLWKPLGFLLLTVYWFNPLLWLAYKLFCKDMEMACDEKVISRMNLQEVKEYSSALLLCGTVPQKLGSYPLAFGETNIKTRIKSILHYKKPTLWIIIGAAVACLAVSLCFLTNPTPGQSSGQQKAEEHPVVSGVSSQEGGVENTVEIIANETAPVVFRLGDGPYGDAVLDLSHVASVAPYQNDHSENACLITLTPEGTNGFAKITKENIGREISIWLCNTHSYSATIATDITSGQLIIYPEDANFSLNLAWFAKEWLGEAACGYTSLPVNNQYEMVNLLYQTGDNFRDPGRLQQETTEMIRLDNGQYYQSNADYKKNERLVFVNKEEADTGSDSWAFVKVGTAEEYSVNNLNSSSADTSSTNQKSYEDLLATQREGYEFLVRAPENPENLTIEQIENIFYVDLPADSVVTDYKFAIDRNSYNGPMYSLHILMSQEGLNQMLNGPKMNAYKEMPISKAVYVEQNQLSQWFAYAQQLYFLDNGEIVTQKHMEQTELYVMKEWVNGKREVVLRFQYDEEYVATMNQ